MSVEAIKKIKESEQNGNEIIAKANAEAKEIIKNARTDGAHKYEDIIKSAKMETAKILEDAEKEGANIAEPIISKCAEEGKKYLNMEKNKMDGAIKLIYERIVKSHGNS